MQISPKLLLKSGVQIFALVLLVFLLVLVEKDIRQHEAKQASPPESPELENDRLILYAESGPETIKIIDQQKNLLKQWQGIDADRAELLSNCNLLVLHGSKHNLETAPWKDLLNRVSEYDWQGRLVWSYTADGHLHHDLVRLENGNTLLLMKATIPGQYQSLINDKLRRQQSITADQILEVSPEGKIVWQWNSWDHIDLNDCGAQPCLGQSDLPLDRRQKKDISDWTHINTLKVIPENKWYDAGDARFKPGNLLILPRNFWQIMVVDRQTGKITYRFRSEHAGGMVRGHEVQMIAKGNPGAGNLLVLDNGFDGIRESSLVLEIDPSIGKVVWSYQGNRKNPFYTRARGAVQRLSNGQTFVSDDLSARMFTVNPEKKIVWSFQTDQKLIVRAQQYARDYCPRLKML